MGNIEAFFRDDDVRGKLDYGFLTFSNFFLKQNVPVSYAVEPANLCENLVEFLCLKLAAHSSLVEIIQHGYDHGQGTPIPEWQILKGQALMDFYFGRWWTPIFSFPYERDNRQNMQSLKHAGYLAVTTRQHFRIRNRVRRWVENRLSPKPIRDIPAHISIIKRYCGDRLAQHYGINELEKQIDFALKHTRTLGIVLHHRYHGKHLWLIQVVIDYLRQRGATFKTMGDLLEEEV